MKITIVTIFKNLLYEKLILPKENSLLKFEKIEHMIKTPFTIYYDIETYNQHLEKTKQFKKIENTAHEKL